MLQHHTPVDRVFYAMSDPTRMAILTRLSEENASASELAKPFDMALPSFMQHLGVLERSELVISHKKGRTRIYELRPETLKIAEGWLEERRSIWERRLDRLDNYLMTMKGKKDD